MISIPSPSLMNLPWNKYFAEGLGAGVLTFAVLSSVAIELAVSTPVIAGLVLGLFVYMIGSISGSHINPAVTVGLWSIGKIDLTNAVGYIASQIIGAFLALFFFQYAAGTVPSITADATLPIFTMEAVGTGILLFGICSVVYGRVSDAAAGLVIGGSLLLGILIASTMSNGVLNPAVAFGIGSVSWSYLAGPLVGAVAGCWLYRWLNEKEMGKKKK